MKSDKSLLVCPRCDATAINISKERSRFRRRHPAEVEDECQKKKPAVVVKQQNA